MIKKLLTKEEFVEYLDEIQSVIEYQKGLNSLFNKHNVDGYVYQPDCVASLIKLLHTIWGEADQDDYIEKFCFESNFGKKAIPNLFLGKDRQDVPVSNSEELYDLLLDLYEY